MYSVLQTCVALCQHVEHQEDNTECDDTGHDDLIATLARLDLANEVVKAGEARREAGHAERRRAERRALPVKILLRRVGHARSIVSDDASDLKGIVLDDLIRHLVRSVDMLPLR